MRRFIPLGLLTAVALGSGCAGPGYATGSVYATGYDDGYGYGYAPDLYYLSPGVQVVAGLNYPVFYSDNYYWRYDRDRWYRSSYYDRGWNYYRTPPRVIARIDQPYRYRNYRPHGYVGRRDGDYYSGDDYRRSGDYYRGGQQRTYRSGDDYRRSGDTYRRSGDDYQRSGDYRGAQPRSYDRSGQSPRSGAYHGGPRSYDRSRSQMPVQQRPSYSAPGQSRPAPTPQR